MEEEFAYIGEPWPHRLSSFGNHYDAVPIGTHKNGVEIPQEDRVTGWACMLRDGTREVFYIGRGFSYIDAYWNNTPIDDVAYISHFPPPVAIGGTMVDQIVGDQLGNPPMWKYIDYDWKTFSNEVVNQAPSFYEWREHLMRLAYEFVSDHHYERGAVEEGTIQRLTSRPSALTDEEMIRNGNISQYMREMIGHLWRLMFEACKNPPPVNSDWNGSKFQLVSRLIQDFCDECSGQDYLGRLHIDHDHVLWEEALSAGKRFMPRTDYEPYGVVTLEPAGSVTNLVSSTDRENFSKALRLYRRIDREANSHPWPDAVTDDWYVPLPEIPHIPPLPGDFSNERTQAALWWSRQWLEAQNHRYSTSEHLELYRHFIEMQLLAVLRVKNWEIDNVQALRKMLTNRRVTANYFMTHQDVRDEAKSRWSDPIATSWQHGYLIYHPDEGFDTDLDPSIRESVSFAISQTVHDPRVSGYVTFILGNEIDRSDENILGQNQPWTAQNQWESLINLILDGPLPQ